MKAKKINICWLMFILPIWLYAQTKISGTVNDGKQVLIGVNVILLKTDSSYLAGVVTDVTGKYEFKNVSVDSCQIIFSLVGYTKKTVNVKLETEILQMSDVIMEEEAFQMDAVIVNSKRTGFKIEPGKTTVDLSAASIGSDGSVLNALGKIPGILILNDGTVLLNGQAGANVMIDDKLTYLSGENLVNLLRSMPTSAINKIEMVTQPSAKYDAGGAVGVINILRKKNGDGGLNLIVSSNAEAGKYFRQNQSVSLRFQKNKYTFYSDYSFYNREDFMKVYSSRQYFKEVNLESTDTRLEMQANRKFNPKSHYFKTAREYEFSEKLIVGAHLRANWFERNKNEIVFSNFSQDLSTLLTENNQYVNHSNFEIGSNLSYEFNSKVKWQNGLNILNFKQQEELNQKSRMINMAESFSENELRGMMDGNIRIINLESEITFNQSDKFTFHSGIKSSSITIDNQALYNFLDSGIWTLDEKLSSGFFYKERILASYIQSYQKWSSRFSTDLGLRYEHTATEGSFLLGNRDSILSRPYDQLFPSISLNYIITDNHSISLQYGKRIVRPNYRDLNPFTDVNDRYLQEKGNTGLYPELVNNFEASWLIKSQYMLSLFYTVRKNPIAKSYLTEPDSDVTIVMPLNLKQSHAMGFRLNLTSVKPVKWWTAQFNSSIIYKQFHWWEAGKMYSNELLSPTTQINNQFRLPKQWAVEASGYLNGTMAEGQAKIGSFGSMSLGVRKSFFENKLSLYVYANDIFLSSGQRISLKNSILAGKYKEQRDSRMIGMTLTWRFNSGKISKTIVKGENSDESKRINL